MSPHAAVATGCAVLSLAAAVGALRCLADHLLTSAVLYTAVALALLGGAVHVAVSVL